MLQLPVNTAPGSMASCLVWMSHWILAVAFRLSRSWQVILPETVPSMSELWQCTSPSITPVCPTISRPRAWMVPFTLPSMRRLLSERISPSMEVPSMMELILPVFTGSVDLFMRSVFLSLRNTIVDDEGGAVQCAKITGSGTYPIAPAGSSW